MQKGIALPPFGIEEEFQIIDPYTFQLSPKIFDVLSHVPSSWHNGYPSMTSDVHKCIIESKTAICRTLDEAQQQLQTLHRIVHTAARSSSVFLCGGGVHPFSDAKSQQIVDCSRYKRLRKERGSNWEHAVVFGLHMHVGIPNETTLFSVFNALRYVIPTLIALTANSPFYQQKLTSYASNRLRAYSLVPTANLPPFVKNWATFAAWMSMNRKHGVLEEQDVYWDIRPRKSLGTLEVRFIDKPYTIEQTMQIVCLILGIIGVIISSGTSWLSHYACTEAELQRNRSVAIQEGMSSTFKLFGKQVTALASAMNIIHTLQDLEFEDERIQEGIMAIARVAGKGQTFVDQIIDSWRQKGNDLKHLVASLCTYCCDMGAT